MTTETLVNQKDAAEISSPVQVIGERDVNVSSQERSEGKVMLLTLRNESG
jgi:hypothetical protein